MKLFRALVDDNSIHEQMQTKQRITRGLYKAVATRTEFYRVSYFVTKTGQLGGIMC
jgi:hypothetical protein